MPEVPFLQDISLTYVVITCVFGLIQAVVVALIARDAKRREKQNAIRAEESRLSMKMMSANMSLACAIAYAQKEGRVNGKTDDALAEAKSAQSEYFAFVNRIASERVTAN